MSEPKPSMSGTTYVDCRRAPTLGEKIGATVSIGLSLLIAAVSISNIRKGT